MDENTFNKRKEYLILLINDSLQELNITKEKKSDVTRLYEILSSYSYENKTKIKGLLSYTIADSLNLDYEFVEYFIQFDQSL